MKKHIQDITNDLPASMVVFLIALPLSMGIAMASGVPPGYGLVTAIIGGFVVGAFGGAPILISGPSAGLTVLVLQMTQEHGLATFSVIVILAGVMQIAAGFFKLGRQFQAVSPAVIRGMLTGIGALIIVGQVHVMLDRDIPGSGLENLLSIPSALWKTFTETGDLAHDEAALLGLGTFIIVVLWDRLKPARLKVLPGPLLGVVVAAVVAQVLRLPIKYVAVPENLMELIHPPSIETLAQASSATVLTAALGLAFVASAETLLCASAVARMHRHGSTNYDRELAVHGIANTICGALGVLPTTGAISRSTANVAAGARSRWASPMHAMGILVFVLFAPKLLALVPTSCLAAILIYVGGKLLNPKAAKQMLDFGWPVLSIFLVTFAGVVMVDLLKGIMAGLFLSAFRLMYQMSHVEFELEKSPDPDGDGPGRERWDLHLRGSATFLGLPKLQDVLTDVEPGVELHFHFDELEFIDHACLDLLNEFRDRHAATGGLVVVEWDELFRLRRKRRVPTDLTNPGTRTVTLPPR